MTEQGEDLDNEKGAIDDLSPEDWNFREARKVFIGAILTPLYWLVLFFITAAIAEWKGVGDVDSAWVAILWGVFAVIYTGALTYAGAKHARISRGFETRKGLRYAQGTVIVGAFFTIASVILTVALLND
ncbi:MAG: hypothetical protein U9N79_11275 [Actinomycetota bacterium]|nr:hypothetical protein [Actinomycetota bacterium]